MDDELLVCPYDESHIIHPLRMPRHLLKCRKNHPSVEMAVCPFNGFHEVHPQELRYHMAHCPDKALLDKEFEIYTLLGDTSDGQPKRRQKGYTELPKQQHNKLYDSDDECWDPDNQENPAPWQASSSSRRNEDKTSLRLPKRDGVVAQLAHGPTRSRGNFKPHYSDQQINDRTLDSQLPVRPNGYLPAQSKFCSHLLSDTETDTDLDIPNLHTTFSRAATLYNQNMAPSGAVSLHTSKEPQANYNFSPPPRNQGEETPPFVKTSNQHRSNFPDHADSNLPDLSTTKCQYNTKAVCPQDRLSPVSAASDTNSQPHKGISRPMESQQALQYLARGRALKLLSAATSTERRPGPALASLSQNGRRSSSTSADMSHDLNKPSGVNLLPVYTPSANLAALILGRGRGYVHAQNTPNCGRNTLY